MVACWRWNRSTFDDVAGEVGEERVVSPVRPQPLLGAAGEPGAAHDQSQGVPAGRVGRLGDLRLAAVGVVDVDPGVLVDAARSPPRPRLNPQRMAIVKRTSSRFKRGDRVLGPEPGVHPHRDLTVGAGAAGAGDELVDEPAGAALGVRRAFAHPGVDDLTGVGACRQDRVVAEHLRVAERGALLEVSGDLADRRVESIVNASSPGPAPAAQARSRAWPLTASSWRTCPNVNDRKNVPNVDGAITRWPSTAAVAPGAQHVGVIDVRPAGEDRVHQRQHLAPRPGAADPTVQAHGVVDQRLQPEPIGERRRQHQPGVGDQIVVVEDDLDAVQRLRYSRH